MVEQVEQMWGAFLCEGLDCLFFGVDGEPVVGDEVAGVEGLIDEVGRDPPLPFLVVYAEVVDAPPAVFGQGRGMKIDTAEAGQCDQRWEDASPIYKRQDEVDAGESAGRDGMVERLGIHNGDVARPGECGDAAGPGAYDGDFMAGVEHALKTIADYRLVFPQKDDSHWR